MLALRIEPLLLPPDRLGHLRDHGRPRAEPPADAEALHHLDQHRPHAPVRLTRPDLHGLEPDASRLRLRDPAPHLLRIGLNHRPLLAGRRSPCAHCGATTAVAAADFAVPGARASGRCWRRSRRCRSGRVLRRSQTHRTAKPDRTLPVGSPSFATPVKSRGPLCFPSSMYATAPSSPESTVQSPRPRSASIEGRIAHARAIASLVDSSRDGGRRSGRTRPPVSSPAPPQEPPRGPAARSSPRYPPSLAAAAGEGAGGGGPGRLVRTCHRSASASVNRRHSRARTPVRPGATAGSTRRRGPADTPAEGAPSTRSDQAPGR